MKNIDTYTGTLSHVSRLNSSVNGNPRFEGCIIGKEFETIFRTSPDSSLGYSIQNFENKEVRVQIGEHYNQNTLVSIELINGGK